MLGVTKISNAISSPLARITAYCASPFLPASNFILSLASTTSRLILNADKVALQLASRRFTETNPNIPPKPVHESDRPFSWVEPALDVKEIDPAFRLTTFGNRLIKQMFEGLTVLDLDGRPTAGAAERWTASDDKMTWTFYLRRDARWSNGEPVTAGDFITAYARALDPLSEGAAIDDMGLIKNAMAFKTRKITDFNDVGVKAILGLPKEKVKTTSLDPNMRIAKMEKGDFQAGTIGNCVGMRGAVALFEGLYSDSPYNMGGYKSTAYDELLIRMRAAPSLEGRKSAMFDAERLLQEDVPVVTIYQSATSYLLKPGVENFRLENGLYFNAKYLRYGPPL